MFAKEHVEIGKYIIPPSMTSLYIYITLPLYKTCMYIYIYIRVQHPYIYIRVQHPYIYITCVYIYMLL